MTMTSSRPYLIRAVYEWIVENECTPCILVNALAKAVEVPREYVRDGRITLNISTSATHNLSIRNEAIDFTGRFAGTPTRVFIPISAVTGIVARENGRGMIFDGEQPDSGPPAPERPVGAVRDQSAGAGKRPGAGKSRLRLIK